MFKESIDFIRAYQLRRDFERASDWIFTHMAKELRNDPSIVPEYYSYAGAEELPVAVSIGVGKYAWGTDQNAAVSIEFSKKFRLTERNKTRISGCISFYNA